MHEVWADASRGKKCMKQRARLPTRKRSPVVGFDATWFNVAERARSPSVPTRLSMEGIEILQITCGKYHDSRNLLQNVGPSHLTYIGNSWKHISKKTWKYGQHRLQQEDVTISYEMVAVTVVSGSCYKRAPRQKHARISSTAN